MGEIRRAERGGKICDALSIQDLLKLIRNGDLSEPPRLLLGATATCLIASQTRIVLTCVNCSPRSVVSLGIFTEIFLCLKLNEEADASDRGCAGAYGA